MGKHVSGRRIVAGGLTCVAAGATTLVWGLAGPASAHGNQEPEGPIYGEHDCLSLADEFEIDQEWQELVIDDVDVEAELFENTYDLGNGESVSISVEQGKYVEWESTIGIDAVYVEGSDDEKGSYFYLYAPGADDEEAFDDYHLGTPPWDKPEKNKIESISFCYDDEAPPSTTVPPTTEGPTTTVAPTTVPPTEPTITTPPPTETVPPTEPSTTIEGPTTTVTTPPTSAVSSGELPDTGSNSTVPMALAGVGLVAVGAGVLVITRKLRNSGTAA